MIKTYKDVNQRNVDINNLLKLGYTITKIYGDNITEDLTVEYQTSNSNSKKGSM